MASAASNRAFTARAAAILTTGEVAGTSFDLNESWGSRVSVDMRFTLGSLTNGIFRFYVSMDGTTWVPVTDEGGNVSYTHTASTDKSVGIAAPGWRFLRVSVQGTGTTTSSSATTTIRYLRRGSQG